ncbi:hypothetical protein [Halostella litorea]|uniref:hypothetical protein n=1 Tax=Halostella litorea TaxID=2528831 RepID=UPI00109320BA|nr:hypothetical protein [Halostella litorea]
MTPLTRISHVYEVQFDVPGQCREAYDAWLEADALRWVTHYTVAGFEVFHNEQGLSPETKLVFEFESLREWARFAGSDTHRAAIDRLESLTEHLDATLWERDDLQLSRGPTATEGAGCDGEPAASGSPD